MFQFFFHFGDICQRYVSHVTLPISTINNHDKLDDITTTITITTATATTVETRMGIETGQGLETQTRLEPQLRVFNIYFIIIMYIYNGKIYLFI